MPRVVIDPNICFFTSPCSDHDTTAVTIRVLSMTEMAAAIFRNLLVINSLLSTAKSRHQTEDKTVVVWKTVTRYCAEQQLVLAENQACSRVAGGTAE